MLASKNQSFAFWLGGILNSDPEWTWVDSQPVSCFKSNISKTAASGTLRLVMNFHYIIGLWKWKAGFYEKPFICKKG